MREWIARSRIEIDQARLLVLKAAWLMDTRGNAAARSEVAMIKVAAHGGRTPRRRPRHPDLRRRRGQRRHRAGPPYAITRALQIADGPNEVHLRTIARLELKRHSEGAVR